MYSLESPHRGDSNENTYHTLVLEKLKEIALLCPPPHPGAMINTHKLEVPPSRTSLHGFPKVFEPFKFYCYSS